MAELKFSDNHSVAVFLLRPLAAHNDFKSMVHGLKKCCLAYALTSCPIIFQDLVKQFWNTAVVRKENDEVSLEAIVNGRKVVVSEQVIRKIL